jgi:hypothetical protein
MTMASKDAQNETKPAAQVQSAPAKHAAPEARPHRGGSYVVDESGKRTQVEQTAHHNRTMKKE